MSAFPSARPRSKGEVTPQSIQKMLDENHHLIQCIVDYQSRGKTAECTQYQQMLHRNLVYLATIADSNQNVQSLLPAPPTPNISPGPGGPGQTGGLLPSNLNDNAVPGGSLPHRQTTNGPSSAPMQQQPGQVPSALPSTSIGLPSGGYGSSVSASGYGHAAPSSWGGSVHGRGSSSSSSSTTSSSSSSSRSNLNMQLSQVSMMHQQPGTPHYSSAQAGGQHYQGHQAMSAMGSQGSGVTSQRSAGAYRPSQQAPGNNQSRRSPNTIWPRAAQQYLGQEEFYREQYGHAQSAGEATNQQYYPDGPGEFPYQASSYGERGYERPFDESSLQYYEGGNSQYSQQQAQYQQGAGQQQPFGQQQYSSQQGYAGRPQGYGAAQAGSGQYSQFQQDEGQAYASYRSSQGGPGAQNQRPYAFEQGQYGNYQQ